MYAYSHLIMIKSDETIQRMTNAANSGLTRPRSFKYAICCVMNDSYTPIRVFLDATSVKSTKKIVSVHFQKLPE